MDEGALVRQYTLLVTRLGYQLVRQLPPSVQVDDLVQSGLLGLLDAARHYDASRGASFETYAAIRIRGAMLDSLRERGVRRLSRHVRGSARAVAALEQEYMRPPRAAEIAARLGLDLQAYHEASTDTHRAESLGEFAHERIPSTEPGPEEIVTQAEFGRELRSALAELSARERRAWELYFDDDLTLREAGAALGISESRLCQVLRAVGHRLRRRLTD